MCSVCQAAKSFVDKGMACCKRATVEDAVVFKVWLLSLGALLGGYFAKPLKRWRPLLWAVSVAGYAWLIWRLLSNEKE